MIVPALSLSRRTRRTPFTDRVEAAGVRAYTVYNHMLLPTVFESLEADAAHLKRHVQLWDVSCQRQVEVRGRDALRLVQHCTPRDLSNLAVGQCRYIPLVDEHGGMLNDPVIMRMEADLYWVSIADSDVMLWMQGLARGMGLDVAVGEVDVAPLAVQGPRAEEVMARAFGEAVRNIRFFRNAKLEFDGHPLVASRSGFSKQGGFEIYVDDPDVRGPLWDALMRAGAEFDIRPGGPNLIERIEGGLLSYGNDMTRANSPFECNLDAICSLDTDPVCIGAEALRRERERGVRQRIRGLRIDGDAVPSCREPWPIRAGNDGAGIVTSAVWSPDCGTNVALGMVAAGHQETGTRVDVGAPDGTRTATVCDLPHR